MTFDWQSFGETVGMLGAIIASVYKIALVPLRERIDALVEQVRELGELVDAIDQRTKPRKERRR